MWVWWTWWCGVPGVVYQTVVYRSGWVGTLAGLERQEGGSGSPGLKIRGFVAFGMPG